MDLRPGTFNVAKDTIAYVAQDPNPIPGADTHPLPPAGGLDWLAWGGVSALALWNIGRMVVRRFVKDSTEIVKDRAESNIVILLQEDNAKLRRTNEELQEKIEVISKERNDAVSQLGRFLAETELYKEKITELQASVVAMSNKLEEQNILLRSVLIENAQLKSQVEHLEHSNEKLGQEIDLLRQKIVGENA